MPACHAGGQHFESAWLLPTTKEQSLSLFLSARKSRFFDAQRFGGAAGSGCSFRCLGVCRLCIDGVALVLPPVEWIWMASSPINPTPFSTAMNDIK